MVASAFPLVEIVQNELDERAKAAEGRATDGAVGPGDLPFVPGAEGSVFAPANGTGSGPATGQGGSSSRQGPLPANQGQASASGSALIDQILGAAQLMGHDVQVPPLPHDQIAAETPLRAAILSWIAATGADVPPEELTRELARADAMPIALQRDLALLLLSAVQATVLQHAALAQLTDQQLAWVYMHPEVAQDLARGIDTPETRYMASLAALVDTTKSIEASLLLLQAVDATRGSLSQQDAQQALLGLQAGDVDAQTGAVLALLASGGSRMTDADKVRFAAEIVATTSGIAVPASQPAVAFPEAVQALMQSTDQVPDAKQLEAVLARADLLPLDLQGAIAGLLVAQAAAVDASDPSRYTPTGQAQALAGVLVAVADALPVLEKYNLYWRGAPEALRVAQWQPALRIGWAAEHAALLRATHADPVDLVRAGGILHGADLAQPVVPSRSFVDAYAALVEQSGNELTPEMREAVASAGETLSPAVRDAAARMMSGAAEASRLHKEAFAAVSPEDAEFLLTGTFGLDALYLAPTVSDADLARLARASAIAAHVDISKLAASAAVGALATSEAREILAGEGAYATQGVVSKIVPTGLRALLARLLPFGAASAQSTDGACQDIPLVLGFTNAAGRTVSLVSSDCANDILLRIESIFNINSGYSGADDKQSWFGFGAANSEVLVISGTGSSTREPLTSVRFTCQLDGTNCVTSAPFQHGAPIVSIDLGGADTYIGPVAVTSPGAFVPVSLALDYDGTDFYANPTPLYDSRSPIMRTMGPNEGHPSQGSAIFGGVAILLDAGGDDTYDAPHFSQGFGRYGTGALVDLGGKDTYMARGVSQGAATDHFNLGAGILADAGGNDNYRTPTGQGYGLGGLLLDAGGVDSYSNEHDASGAPMLHLEVVPGGNVTTLNQRGDNKVWLDGPGTLTVGIAVDTEVTLSGRDSDGDGDSDFLEFVTGSDPNSNSQKAIDGPGARVSKVLVDTDGDLYPDFVERALSTDPENGAEYPAGFPVGPEFILPSEARTLLGESVGAGAVLDGLDGPRGHDKILDLRLPLQDAGTIDYACTGPIMFNTTLPGDRGNSIGWATGFMPSTDTREQREDGTMGPARNCVRLSYATEGPGQGNATLPLSANQSPPQFTFRLPAGILAIGDSVETAYAEDYFVAIDLGGDDSFTNSAGGALLVATRNKPGTDASYNRTFLAPSLVVNVDPANYDARVASPARSFGRDVYANASRDYVHGALFGVLVDTGGNDAYVGGNGSQGSVGGVLLDLRDNDTYVAANLSQGATLGGTPSQTNRPGYPEGGATPSEDALARRSVPAMLLDLGAGNDVFSAGSHSQGFARGMIVTCDNSGGSFSSPCASRNAPVSAGILFNAEGNDRYDTTAQRGANSQGVATQGGLGVLLDTGGLVDVYQAWGVISQGSAVSQAFNTGDKTAPNHPRPGLGALLDTTGSDTYLVQRGTTWQSRGERSNNLTVSRYEAPVSGDQTAYVDIGLHLDAESSDPVKALGAVGGVGGSNPDPTSTAGGFALRLPTARLAIGSAADTHYDREYAFVVDLGGVNKYDYNAGGFVPDMVARSSTSNLVNPADDTIVGLFPVSFLLDAGSGSSVYKTGRGFAQGAGLFSTGVLVDLGGHDTFAATPETVPTFGNDWMSGNLILDGTIGEATEWSSVQKRDFEFVSVRDPRITTKMAVWIGNDQQNLTIAIQGKTLSEGPSRLRDALVIDLDPGHRMREWDSANNMTGVDQLLIEWDSETSCRATDRFFNATHPHQYSRDDKLLGAPGRAVHGDIACRMLEDGRFTIELRKSLVADVPLDRADMRYRSDEDRGFDMRELGFRLEFREAGTGYTNGEPYVYTYPAGTTNRDGNLTFRKGGEVNATLADEMAAWAVTSLANLGKAGTPSVHTRVPAVSQGAAVSGVGVLAMLGNAESHASLSASDRAQGYGAYGGFGVLVDAGGSDRYSGTKIVQGAAESNGLALLLELEGHDNYIVAGDANGWNPANTQSAGLFLDLSGDDEYRHLAPTAVVPGTAATLDLPPGAPLPPGNQRVWIQNQSFAMDHNTLGQARGLAAGSALNNLYANVRTDLSVTVHEPGAADAHPDTGCTARPVPVSAAVQKPVVTGTVCLRATVKYAPKGFLATANGGTVNVTSVDLFADRIRLGTVTSGRNVANGVAIFETPITLASVQDGVTRLTALAAFTVKHADGRAFVFYDDVKEDVVSNASKVVLVDNLPKPSVELTPRFGGVANSTFSPNAYGDKRQLLVNWTVPHDANEDRLDAYMGWSAPARLSNVPCKGAEGRLCNILPFYLTGNGKTFGTTPGSRLAGETDTIFQEKHNGTTYSQTTPPVTTELVIPANGSFRLTLPERLPVFPGSESYTTRISITAVLSGREIELASGNFTSTQSSSAGDLAAGAAGKHYDDLRAKLKGPIDDTTAKLEGNVLYNAIHDGVTRVCDEKFAGGGYACGILTGDPGKPTNFRPCTSKSGNPFNLLVPIVRGTGLCTTYTPANVAYTAASEGGPIVNDAVGDVTEEAGLGRTDVSTLGQTFSETTDVLQPSSSTTLNWSDFFLDVNESLVDETGHYKLPKGAQLKLEFSLTSDVIGEIGSLNAVQRWGEVLKLGAPALEFVPEEPFPGLKLRDQVKYYYYGSQTSLRGQQETLANPIPLSVFRYATGPEAKQPRLEIRTPAEPSTVATITLERVVGETSAVLLAETNVEGDIPGSPTRAEWVANASLQDRYMAEPTNVTAPRFTQRNVTFNGCCSVTGGEVEDGVYYVRVKATDGVGAGEAIDTVLVDRTAPVSVITTPTYVGRGLLEDNRIPIRWTAFEAGSRLDYSYVFVKEGSDDLGTMSSWTQLGDPLKQPVERTFPAERRSASTVKGSGDTYFVLVIGVDRAGNVEAAPGADNLSAALQQAFDAKLAQGEGVGYSRIIVDQGAPLVSATDVTGARLLSFQGSDFYFVKAGERVAFSVCARDPEQNGGLGKMQLNLDYYDAATGNTISYAYDAQSTGPCGESGFTRFEFADWGLVNTDKERFPDGVWAASYDVYDLAGNRVQVAVASFVLDSKAPSLRLESPIFPAGQTAVKPGDRVSVRLFAEDKFGINENRVHVDASSLTTDQNVSIRPVRANGILYQEATIHVNRADLLNQNYTVEVTVYDNAGNARTGSVSIPVDFRKFEFKPGSLQVRNVTHNSAVIVWSTTEPATSLAKFGTSPVDLRGRTPINVTGVYEHEVKIEGLLPKTRYFVKAVSSSAGGFTNESDALEIETGSALFLQPISPAAGSAVSGAVPVKFRGGLRDSTDFVTYTLQVQPKPDADWAFVTTLSEQGETHTLTFNSTRYLDGTGYRLRLVAEAGKDRTEATFGPFMSDNTLPTLVVVGPLVATNDTTPRVVAEIRDNLAGFETSPATLLIDGVAVPEGVVLDTIPDGLRVSYDVPSALPPGPHTFELRVADKAGNVVRESWKVSIDGDAPQIVVNPTAYSPGTEAAKLGGTVTINLTVKDQSGVSIVTANTSALSAGQPTTRLTRLLGTDIFTGTFPVTAGDAGAVKRIPIVATDLAGNTRTLDVEIPVDNVPPVVGEAHAVDVGHTRGVLVAQGNEPIVLAATATAANSPAVTASMRNASLEARLVLDGLLPSRTYQYQLQALDRAGNAVTLGGNFETVKDTKPPTAVGPLSVIDLLNGTLRLTWAPATDDVAIAFYRVYRSEDGTTFLPHAEVRAPAFDDANLPYEKQFVYQVVAVDHGANEGPSEERLRASATAVPRLTAGLVTPTVGSTTTTFRYTATYVSPGGVAPAYVRIILDGVAQNMTLVSGTPLEGAVYAYETRLAPHSRDEPHTYSFEASDGRYAVQFPEDGSTLRGPLVSGDVAAGGAAGGFAAFAQRVPVAGAAGTALAMLVAVVIVGLVVRRKKEGSQ